MIYVEIVATIILPLLGYVVAEYVGLVKRDAEFAGAIKSLESCLNAITDELRELRERIGDCDKRIYHLEQKDRKCE